MSTTQEGERMDDKDTEAMTLRLPRSLKEAIESAARARGMTLTAFVRESLRAALAPPPRGYTHPGYTKRFQAFLDEAVKQNKHIVVLTENPHTGVRAFCDGRVHAEHTNESLLALSSQLPATVLRRDVVAWFDGEFPVLHRLALSLIQEGWKPHRRWM